MQAFDSVIKLTGKSETEIISSICVIWGRWGGKEKVGGKREMTTELVKEGRKKPPTKHEIPVCIDQAKARG
jgi:hypothetical protein